MPAPDVKNLDSPLPFYRGLETVTIGSADIEFGDPRAVQVVTAGNLVFVDEVGNEHTLNGLAAGANVVGPHGAGVYVSVIRGASTVTSVLTGIT